MELIHDERRERERARLFILSGNLLLHRRDLVKWEGGNEVMALH